MKLSGFTIITNCWQITYQSEHVGVSRHPNTDILEMVIAINGQPKFANLALNQSSQHVAHLHFSLTLCSIDRTVQEHTQCDRQLVKWLIQTGWIDG